jgi:hypothetical protein
MSEMFIMIKELVKVLICQMLIILFNQKLKDKRLKKTAHYKNKIVIKTRRSRQIN